jgi:predicted transcriptional regulator
MSELKKVELTEEEKEKLTEEEKEFLEDFEQSRNEIEQIIPFLQKGRRRLI